MKRLAYTKQFSVEPTSDVKEIVKDIQQPKLFYDPSSYKTLLYFYSGIWINPNTCEAYVIDQAKINKSEPYSTDTKAVTTKDGHVYFEIEGTDHDWILVETEFFKYDYLKESYKLIRGNTLPKEVMLDFINNSASNIRYSALPKWLNSNCEPGKKLVYDNGVGAALSDLTYDQALDLISLASLSSNVKLNIMIQSSDKVVVYSYRGTVENSPDGKKWDLRSFLDKFAKNNTWWIELAK